jgi:hypothetical protein
LLAFHVARVLLIVPLALTVSWASAQFLHDRSARQLAVALVLFGSGVGAWVAWSGAGESVTDLWAAESLAYLSASFSPHFVASWTLLLLAIVWGWRSQSRASRADAVRSGVSALLLFQFHPFYVPVVWVLLAAFAAEQWQRQRGGNATGCAMRALVSVAISLPSVLYHAWLVVGTPNRQFMLGSNVLETPPAPLVVLGLLGYLAFGYLGARQSTSAAELEGTSEQEARARTRALVIWSLVQGALAFAPFTFQRRLLEGLTVPLATLSTPWLVPIWRRSQRWRMATLARTAALALLAAVMAPSTVFALVDGAQRLRTNWRELQLLPPSEAAALDWLSRQPEDAVVLAGYRSGNLIGGWTDKRVVVGHWNNTISWQQKQEEARTFMRTSDEAFRGRLIAAYHITRVWVGPRERAWGTAVEHSTLLTPVYTVGAESSRVTIYQVRDTRAPGRR